MKIVLLLLTLFCTCSAIYHALPFRHLDFPRGFRGFGHLGHFRPPLHHVQNLPSPFFNTHIFGPRRINFDQRGAFRSNGLRRFGFVPFDNPRDYRAGGALRFRYNLNRDIFLHFDRRRPVAYTYETEGIRRRSFGNRGVQTGFRGNRNIPVFYSRQSGNTGIYNSRGPRYERERPEYIVDYYDNNYNDNIDRFGEERSADINGLGDIRQRELDRLAENGEIMFRDLRKTENFRNDRPLGFNEVGNYQRDTEGQHIFRMSNNFRRNNNLMSRHRPLTKMSQEISTGTTKYISDLSKGMTDMIHASEQNIAINGGNDRN